MNLPDDQPHYVNPDTPDVSPDPNPDTPPLSPGFSTATSFYDDGMFMCEPCFHSGTNQCVFAEARKPSGDWTDYDYSDPHADHSWVPNYDPKGLTSPRQTGKPGETFPACASGTGVDSDGLTHCYFPESRAGMVDACMRAVFDPIGANFSVGSAANPRTQQALALAAAREAACPEFICRTRSMRAGNGTRSFATQDCRCASPSPSPSLAARAPLRRFGGIPASRAPTWSHSRRSWGPDESTGAFI
jgi:hypothetical protein